MKRIQRAIVVVGIFVIVISIGYLWIRGENYKEEAATLKYETELILFLTKNCLVEKTCADGTVSWTGGLRDKYAFFGYITNVGFEGDDLYVDVDCRTVALSARRRDKWVCNERVRLTTRDVKWYYVNRYALGDTFSLWVNEVGSVSQN